MTSVYSRSWENRVSTYTYQHVCRDLPRSIVRKEQLKKQRVLVCSSSPLIFWQHGNYSPYSTVNQLFLVPLYLYLTFVSYEVLLLSRLMMLITSHFFNCDNRQDKRIICSNVPHDLLQCHLDLTPPEGACLWWNRITVTETVWRMSYLWVCVNLCLQALAHL